jgi:hypothetical protein
MKDITNRITDEPETIDEAYQRLRFESLTPEQQHFYLLHLEDQFDAVPSYFDRPQQD